MSDSKFDLKEALAVFKYLNAGGVLSVIVIGAVVGVMYASGCGPIVHSSNYGEHEITGRPILQDHPEAPAEDDHAPHADDHGEHHEEPAAH